MWSPTKLNFLFYDFSVIYYDFSNIQRKIKKPAGTVATLVTVAARRRKPPRG
jgi:hypothetical protein